MLPLTKFISVAPVIALVVTPQVALAQKPTDLIGKDLSNWVKRGGNADFAIKGNEIVGRAVMDTPNSFLCTKKSYGDFVLEYDFRVDPRLNSGVQIRSECFDHETQVQWRDKTIVVPAGRVHGYQIEIDPDPKRDRWWTAGVYDEGRRDWLYPGQLGGNEKEFTEQGRKNFRQGEWNHVKVEALGPTIKTWLNGKACASITDSMTIRGFIGLQVHNIGNDASLKGIQVRWKNMKITDLTPKVNTLSKEERAAGWTLLWDGKTSKGWRSAKADQFPAKGWEMENGILSVLASGGAESAAGGDIVTRERYNAFELLVDFKISPGANSGIKYFCQPNLDPVTGTGAKSATGSAIGLEYQILDDALHPDAKLGLNGDRTLGSLYDLIPAAKSKRPAPVGEWNTARIVCTGKHVQHWLNGQLVLEYDRGSRDFRGHVAESKFKSIPGFGEWSDGHILLQDHGDRVSFCNIKLRKLPVKG